MGEKGHSQYEKIIADSRSLISVFNRVSAIEPDRNFLHAIGTVRRSGEEKTDSATAVVTLSYRQAQVHVTLLADWLIRQGVSGGERVFLLSENRSEWALWDLAIMSAGAVSVPLFTTSNPEDWSFILSDSGARIGMVSTVALFRSLQQALISTQVERVLTLELAHLPQLGIEVTSWQQVIQRPLTEEANASVEIRSAQLSESSTALLCYTSGTSGRPRGVIQTHGNLLANVRQITPVLYELDEFRMGEESFLSVLPMGHAYEHTAGVYLAMAIGSRLWYPPSVDRLVSFLGVARPTMMMAVPRLLEILRDRIQTTARGGSRISYWLFRKTLAVGMCLKAAQLGPTLDPLPVPGFGQRLFYATLGRLVRRKVRRRFGGRLKALISGGGPLTPEVAGFFSALGLTILQGYGQTETAPVVSANLPRAVRHDTVGFPLPGVSVRLAADGEIEVSGQNVTPGYWHNEEATSKLFTADGWIKTGDIGSILPSGHLKIIDRKKDIIINSSGDNVSPQRVEGKLCLEPDIDQAMVYGDRKPHLVALIVPSEALREALESGTMLKQQRDELLNRCVGHVNRQLGRHERIRSFIVAKEPFTAANRMLTPSLKIRRQQILEVYAAELERLYGAAA